MKVNASFPVALAPPPCSCGSRVQRGQRGPARPAPVAPSWLPGHLHLRHTRRPSTGRARWGPVGSRRPTPVTQQSGWEGAPRAVRDGHRGTAFLGDEPDLGVNPRGRPERRTHNAAAAGSRWCSSWGSLGWGGLSHAEQTGPAEGLPGPQGCGAPRPPGGDRTQGPPNAGRCRCRQEQGGTFPGRPRKGGSDAAAPAFRLSVVRHPSRTTLGDPAGASLL